MKQGLKLSVILFIVRHYLVGKKSDAFISFISKTATTGVVLGVMALIIVLSVMNGFAYELQYRILEAIPHATLKSDGSPISDWRPIAKEVQLSSDKVRAIAPANDLDALIIGKNGSAHYASVNGILPEAEKKFSNIEENMLISSLDDLKAGEYKIILGNILAKRLKVMVDDNVTLVLPELNSGLLGLNPTIKTFRVVGIFKMNSQIDTSYAFINIGDAAYLKKIAQNEVETLKIDFHNVFDAQSESLRIWNLLPKKYVLRDWSYYYGTLFSAIAMEKRMISLLLFLIVIVAAFNILATFVMIVKEKSPEIAILRTMGALPSDIVKIFILQGTMLGFIGVAVGVLLGIPLAMHINEIFEYYIQLTGQNVLSLDNYFINYLPTKVMASDILLVAGVSLGSCILATIYPAVRASKLNPVSVLKNDG